MTLLHGAMQEQLSWENVPKPAPASPRPRGCSGLGTQVLQQHHSACSQQELRRCQGVVQAKPFSCLVPRERQLLLLGAGAAGETKPPPQARPRAGNP